MPQALYRRYRPETFADVIGQQHVTEPLQQALRRDRTHHAYLFSGPRGCGKTTSARILARCLNCAEGPTATPCGKCQSCLDLGTGGPGSLDVIEIDAASHGGVDDARDLRERAFYAPAASRFKIYIIDEAQMVSREGFNALLKLVEEPPEHVKFIFATTEPEKVIATIRSRTHHYPFRLVPPGELLGYLHELCEREQVEVDAGVLQLVVRAGRGSVRDSLSVLDQLMAGASDAGVSYALAVSLLGFTDASLLDDTIEAFAAGDAAAMFRIIDQVVEAGHDPRRFAEDLLERLRDLIVISAVPDDAGTILGEHPADELERMRQQAARFGAAELSRAADIINSGLTEMRGATAPRLHLELMAARVMLPGADHDERGLTARLDRLERRLSVAGGSRAPAAEHPGSSVVAEQTSEAPPAASAPPVGSTAPAASPDPAETAQAPIAPSAPSRAAPPTGAAPIDLTTIRRMWPDVLAHVAGLKRTTWSLISQSAAVVDASDGRLVLGFPSGGLRDVFLSRSDHQDYVREALIQVLGLDWKVDAIVDPSTRPAVDAGGASGPPATKRSATSTTRPDEAPSQEPAAPPPSPAYDEQASDPPVEPESAPSPDDPDADDGEGGHHDLLARELGARVIGEFDNS